MKTLLWLPLAVALLLTGCLGERTDPDDFFEVPKFDSLAVAYVPILPNWTGFVDPVDIYAGFDETFYVVDAGSQEVIQLDAAGRILGRRQVPGAKAVAQNRRLELLVIGTYDTVTVGGVPIQLDAIYQLAPYENGTNDLTNAPFLDTIIHPLYFNSTLSTAAANVRLNDIDVYADNRFLVTRSGPDNSPLKFGGPDNSVILFDADGTYRQFLRIATNQGISSDYFDEPFSISTFIKPPQVSVPQSNEGFLITQVASGAALKVQYIDTRIDAAGEVEYFLRTDLILGDTTQANGFLYDANKFTLPVGVTATNDGSGLLYVVDAAQDSLYAFTTTGLEGVNPPPGSLEEKNINVSFGGTGQGPLSFDTPSAVAHRNDILYVVDRGNAVIKRYQLTTDFE